MGQKLTDTIVAPATPAQTSALAIMRLSGPDAITIADKIWKGKSLQKAKSHSAHLGTIIDSTGQILDHAVATIYHAPNSFTGEDSVEFTTHGSLFISRQLLDTLTEAGARLAQPGEFTRRALTNGRIDITQAEAIADLIASRTRAAHRIATRQLQGHLSARINHLRQSLIEIATLLELELDFSEEDVEFASRDKIFQLATHIKEEIQTLLETFNAGNAIRNGINIAIAGPTNAGKSTLLNQILGYDRAIVSPIHGTTRDTISEQITIGDHLFNITDTAGLRSTSDPIENIGIQRTNQTIANAQILIYLLDSTHSTDTSAITKLQQSISVANHPHTIIALNKSDLPDTGMSVETVRQFISAPIPAPHILEISAKTGQGVKSLINHISEYARTLDSNPSDILIANKRHAVALQQALDSIHQVLESLSDSHPTELIAQSLRETIHHLSTITGNITSDTILSSIFSRFCIGK